MGYFHESPLKGARQFSLVVKWTSPSASKVRNPLENTFSLTFNFGDKYDVY
jgi:hypothetical protein